MLKFFKVMTGVAFVLGLFLLFGCEQGGASGDDNYSDYVGEESGGGDNGFDNDTSHDSEQECIIIPRSPKNVKAVASGAYSVRVSWDAVAGADSYVVYYRTSLEVGKESLVKNGTELKKTTYNTSILITSLEYKLYLFWVTAKNSAGESLPSVLDADAICFPTISSGGSSAGTGGSTSTITSLSAPTKLTATATSSSSVSLSWNSVSGATEYYIYKSEYNSSSLSSFYSRTTSTSAVVTGLKAGTTYYFWVKAINSTTTSDYSIFDFATTTPLSSMTPSQSYGSVKVVNNSSYPVKNVQMYTTYYASLSGVLLGLDTVIPAGSSATFQNVTPEIYVRIGSETYRNRKISTNKTITVKSGSTSILTITDADIISN